MPTTPNRGLPYPGRHDPPDGPQLARQLATALDARLPGIQVYTASGTWTKPAQLVAIRVRVQGAGGSGGGCEATGSGETAEGGGAGGGGYAEKIILADQLADTESITVGAGGAGASAASSGNTGGTSSFGSHLSATGGEGGTVGAANSSGAARAPGGNGGSGSGGDINCDGGEGGTGAVVNGVNVVKTGTGGESMLGGRAASTAINSDGRPGRQYGGGSSGASSGFSEAARGSTDGADGVVIIEYVY